ncbi:MAG: hypothetical protein DRG66_08430, partial [Deltaproteobacteria bacterium]
FPRGGCGLDARLKKTQNSEMSKKRAGKIPALFVQLVQHIKLLGASLVGVFPGNGFQRGRLIRFRHNSPASDYLAYLGELSLTNLDLIM